MLFSLNACSLQNDNEIQDNDSASRLTVLNFSYNPIDAAIQEFNNLHLELRLEQEFYNDEDTLKLKKNILTELMAGEGPDILLMRILDFPNIHKMIKNNIFYDLDLLIENDKTFKMDDYNGIVMNSGIYEGKRYLMPLYFTIPVMMTTKSFISNNNLNISEDGITWTELSKMAKEFKKDTKNKDKYLISDSSTFNNLVHSSYMKLITIKENLVLILLNSYH